MNDLVREWVTKAEADVRTAEREFAAAMCPNYDDVCFHAQQCAEKYLKALLQARNTAFPRTHDLLELLHLIEPPERSLTELRDALATLSPYSAIFRYPGESATGAMAAQALERAQTVRSAARQLLGLPLRE